MELKTLQDLSDYLRKSRAIFPHKPESVQEKFKRFGIKINEKTMSEQTEKYKAVAEVAALLRESTGKRFKLNNQGEPITAEPEYFNAIFNDEELASLKRRFLKIISEI